MQLHPVDWMPTVQQVEEALRSALEAEDVSVVDISGDCGSSFEVSVVSKQFEGKALLARHRLVNGALAGMMGDIHALSIKGAKTPAQAAGQ